MFAWIILALCVGVIIGCTRYLYRLLNPPQVEYWDGPPFDPVTSSHRMTELMIKYPDLQVVATFFPDEARTAQAVREYMALCNEDVSQEEYERRLDEILKKVDISDIC